MVWQGFLETTDVDHPLAFVHDVLDLPIPGTLHRPWGLERARWPFRCKREPQVPVELLVDAVLTVLSAPRVCVPLYEDALRESTVSLIFFGR